MAKKTTTDNNKNNNTTDNTKIKNNSKKDNKENKLKIKIEELKSFINQCKRVLMITRRPSKEEYLMVSKVTGLGICLLGLIGFAIHVPMMYLKGMLKG